MVLMRGLRRSKRRQVEGELDLVLIKTRCDADQYLPAREVLLNPPKPFLDDLEEDSIESRHSVGI